MNLSKNAFPAKKSLTGVDSVIYSAAMDAKTRVRQRIRRLLEDRGRTQHELAQWLGHGDQWASNLLAGRHALGWDDLDRVAQFFNIPPGELVRVNDEPWELTPTEMRVVRALRMLPPPVRDTFAQLADWTIGVLPDEVDLLMAIRGLDAGERATLLHWVELKRVEEAHARRAPSRADLPEATAPPRPQARRARAKQRG